MKETRRPIKGYSRITYGAFAFGGTWHNSSGGLKPVYFRNCLFKFYSFNPTKAMNIES